MSIVLKYNDSIKVRQQYGFHDKCKYSDIRNIPMEWYEHESTVEFLFDDPYQEFMFKLVWLHVLLRE